VGYGTNKKGRPLSPIEVGLLLRQARDAGESLEECAKALRLNGTGHIGRFLRILELPKDLRHLIAWSGDGKNGITFSCAFELARLPDAEDQRAVVQYILSHSINSKEVRQIAQLRNRSERPISECVEEVLGMRTIVEKRYVFIGSISDQNMEDALEGFSQQQRDSMLASCIKHLDLQGASGRLGNRFFTLVGDGRFDAAMKNIGKENIESLIRTHVEKTVQDVRNSC